MDEIPSFRLRDIETRRDRLYHDAFSIYVEHVPVIDGLVRQIRRRIANADPGAVFESVRHLAGFPLDRATAYQTAWRLAANAQQLQEGKAVYPWSAQRGDEWVPFTILRLVAAAGRKNKAGYALTVRILAGTPAGMRAAMFWSTRYARVAAIHAGFSRFGGRYPMSHTADLVQLRLAGKISAAASREQPAITEVRGTDSLVAWNREHVLKLRCRVGVPCPRQFTHRCHQCAVGYESCRGAVHYRNFVEITCTRCQKQQVRDPEDPEGLCMHCARALRFGESHDQAGGVGS